MYLMTGTRPDIAYAVSRVSQFMNNPGPSHWTAVKKIFGYLKATKNIGICFGGSSCTTSLIGFSDADFAGDLDTIKSMLNNGPISWCKSEYIAASKATKEAIWLRQLLRELHQEQVKPTTIFCDNQSCIRLVHNPEYHKRTKHIDISYHFIRDQFQKHAIDLLYVCSNDQAADIFTKALPPERYRRLRSQLGLFETTKCLLADHKTENEDAKDTLTKDEKTKFNETSEEYILEKDLNKEELELEETDNEKYEDTDVKNKENSEAESKGDRIRDSEAKRKADEVKDSQTSIKGYESVNNSRTASEGANEVNISEEETEASELEESKEARKVKYSRTDKSKGEKTEDFETKAKKVKEERHGRFILNLENLNERKEPIKVEALDQPNICYNVLPLPREDWLNEGLIERVNENPPEVKGYYLPHRPVFKVNSKRRLYGQYLTLPVKDAMDSP
ncbi:hypothetical protein LAZ67_11001823 [Cordylochernes scorpioides]|uniref:Uncharacterized protein n=1 Tax=Cordylochernes scorpioides TaxID=51811 RepID=A0ABY6L104_9ARAC|nr:hypothetical protein LAZ67_11001823 [Cordylochernes scorpioides]